MSEALVPTTALDRLRKTATRTSAAEEFVNARTKRTMLLVDASGSMDDRIKTGERKIDKLRKVVDSLRSTHRVPVAAFGVGGFRQVEIVESVPEPAGGTPLHLAIDFGRQQEANHLVVVTDGFPDSADAAFSAAKAFGHPIDVFYIGDGDDQGAKFCAELARRTGGKCGVTDLIGEPKQLASKIIALLGDGSSL
jgi:Mg-chelatase subunit ChlD